jgi:hypothetical protein
VADPSANDQNDASTADIHTEISTEVSHEGRGTVYAIKTVTQGDRRVDWKIGHIEGTFAEGAEYYYKGDDFHTDPLQRLPENSPRGRFKDDSFHELIDSDSSIEDGKLTETYAYDFEGVDSATWAEEYVDIQMLPETLLNEWCEDKISHHQDIAETI